MSHRHASLAVSASAVAAAALAAVAAPAAADPHLARITKVAVGPCGTDGGAVTCSSGTRYLGDVVKLWWNQALADQPVACAGARPGKVTFFFGFDYNDGTTSVLDDDKVKAKWPACVATFADQVSKKWLEWYKMWQPVDGSIDVNSGYKVTVEIAK